MKTKNYSKLISIIVVSLNTKKKFLKTINSIQEQVYQNYEIIIIDGKSIDGTIKEIKKIKNKKVKYIIQKDNGIYDAMNKGIRKSKGEWIIFLNSGDVFYNQNVLIKIFSKKINKFDILFGDTVVVSKSLSYKVAAKKFTNRTITMPFCHQSTLVKSIYLKKYLFDLNYNLSSDFNFFLNSYYKNLKFNKHNSVISKVEAYGQSDLNRQTVFSQNIRIFLKKGCYFNVLCLFFMKFFDFAKDLIKLFLPAKLVKQIIKIKYQKLF